MFKNCLPSTLSILLVSCGASATTDAHAQSFVITQSDVDAVRDVYTANGVDSNLYLTDAQIERVLHFAIVAVSREYQLCYESEETSNNPFPNLSELVGCTNAIYVRIHRVVQTGLPFAQLSSTTWTGEGEIYRSGVMNQNVSVQSGAFGSSLPDLLNLPEMARTGFLFPGNQTNYNLCNKPFVDVPGGPTANEQFQAVFRGSVKVLQLNSFDTFANNTFEMQAFLGQGFYAPTPCFTDINYTAFPTDGIWNATTAVDCTEWENQAISSCPQKQVPGPWNPSGAPADLRAPDACDVAVTQTNLPPNGFVCEVQYRERHYWPNPFFSILNQQYNGTTHTGFIPTVTGLDELVYLPGLTADISSAIPLHSSQCESATSIAYTHSNTGYTDFQQSKEAAPFYCNGAGPALELIPQ